MYVTNVVKSCMALNNNYDTVVYLGFLNIHILCAGGD